MTYKKHEDERGYFQELCKFPAGTAPSVAQVSICTINAGHTRGNHYHKKTCEVFTVTKGKMTLTLENSSEREEIEMTPGSGGVIIGPFVNHTVTSEEGCEFVILASKLFDPDNPDTFSK